MACDCEAGETVTLADCDGAAWAAPAPNPRLPAARVIVTRLVARIVAVRCFTFLHFMREPSREKGTGILPSPPHVVAMLRLQSIGPRRRSLGTANVPPKT